MENEQLFHCIIKGMPISKAFSAIDILFDYGYSSASCSDNGHDDWQVEIIHPSPIDIAEVRRVLGLDYSFQIQSEQMPEIDWLQRSFQNFKPITVGSFYIYGPHLRNHPAPIDKVGIEIAAATAFGTGTHATTNRCLTAIETYLDPYVHENFLDIGCGSCILSIAAAKLGMRNIVACDNQEEAIRVSKENAVINNVAHRIKIFQNKACEFSEKSYDFVVANILALPLISMKNDVLASLNPGGILVLSGFTVDDNSVEEAYSSLGLSLMHKYTHNEWVSLVYRK